MWTPIQISRAAAPVAGEAQSGLALLSDATGSDPDPGPVPALSTETSNTVRNEDGTYTADVYQTPVNYQDSEGDWALIDNTLVDAPGDTYAVRNAANAYTLSIPQDPSKDPVKFALDGAWLTMKLAGSDDAAPQVDGDTAEISTGTSDTVQYQAQDAGVKETIILGTRPTEPLIYRYTLKVSAGVEPALTDDGDIDFRNAAGDLTFLIPAGRMEDSAEYPAESTLVSYALQRTNSAWILTVTPDLAWLSDAARVYPVAIDPTVVAPDIHPQKDCFLQQEAPGTTHCGEGTLKVGATNTLQLRRALLDFSVASIPAGATINNALVYLYQNGGATVGSGGATTYGLYNPTQDWGACASWSYTCSGGGTWVGGATAD
jgi:hypothetical protein